MWPLGGRVLALAQFAVLVPLGPGPHVLIRSSNYEACGRTPHHSPRRTSRLNKLPVERYLLQRLELV
jgi:hypothetical protein